MEEFKEYLKCLRDIEYETYFVYNMLYSKIEKEEIKHIFLYIGMDSYKHYLIYDRLLNGESSDEDLCRDILGDLFMDSLNSIKQLKASVFKIDKISDEQIYEIISMLVNYEGGVYEEALSSIITRILGENLKGGIKKIFELIEEDEKKHEKLLMDLLIGKTKKYELS
ncbi:hypothetical protein [Fervidicoccus sp.]|uniref:hypothetical protein n=1 Tax=Fervidicoccus sp. TaxID=2060324 RepID=UPI003D1384D2